MNSRLFRMIVLALAIAGCAPQTAPTAPSQTAVPQATRAPAAVPAAGPLFQLYGADPVVQTRAAPFWDRQYIDPGAIVIHDGQFHMFFNGIDGWPRPIGVGYATSADGFTWTKQSDQPVFKAAGTGANFFVTSALVEPDGTWVLYYYTLSGSSFMGKQSIGRATAPAPRGPWKADAAPVLEPGPPGAWDSAQVGSPNVIRTDAGYVMYYDGLLGAESRIGMATSPDGIHWTKYDDPATTSAPYAESDPILSGQPGAWDAARVIDPNVVRAQHGWAMIYESTPGSTKFGSGPYQLGYATSDDGIHWTRFGGNPVISSKDHPDWKGTFLVTLVRQDNLALLYFDVAGARGKSGTSVFLATHTGQL